MGGVRQCAIPRAAFHFPAVRPFFTRETLRGWWGGMVRERRASSSSSHHTHLNPRGFRATAALGLRILSQCRRGAGGETDRRTTTHKQRQQTTQHNGPGQRNKHSSRRSGKATGSAAAEAAAAKAQAATAGQRAAQQQCRAKTDRRTDTAKGNSGRTGAAEEKPKLQHSKRQCKTTGRRPSDAGRDRHPPRRVLHTPSG